MVSISAVEPFKIDFEKILEIANVGVRRAAAFLGLGLSAIAKGPPVSVLLDASFVWQFCPEPLPTAYAERVAIEYESWIVSCALRELDQYFNLFLDEIWHSHRLGELFGKPLSPDFGPDLPFLRDTNVAKKLSMTAAALEMDRSRVDHFQSYSYTRNSLSHGAGVVRERDCNKPGCLVISWLGLDAVIASQEGVFHANQATGLPPYRLGSGLIRATI
jgi:hypothetical protein